MYHVYKEFLQHMLTILIYCRENHVLQDRIDEIILQNYLRSLRGTAREREALAFLENQQPYQSLDVTIDMVTRQLTCPETEHDRDLITSIVEILQLPHPRNSLSGNTLRDLSLALLLPDEIAGVKLALASTRACSRCGHKLSTGEMCSFSDDAFICTRCARPTLVADDYDTSATIRVTAIRGLSPSLKKTFGVDCTSPTHQAAPPEDFVADLDGIIHGDQLIIHPQPDDEGIAHEPR